MNSKEKVILSTDRNKFLLKLFHSHVNSGKRVYREHHHTEFEIAIFKTGSGTYKLKNTEYSIKEGDIFIFSSDEVHCITEINDDEMVLMNIHFEPRFIWSHGNDLFDERFLKIFFNRSDNFQNRLDRNNPTTNEIRNLLLNIEDEFSNKFPEYELMIKVNLLKILVLLVRNYDYVNEDDNRIKIRKKNLHKIEECMNYIDDNLEKDINLDQLSKISNMCKTYFSTTFKKLNGISPWDYITIKRVEKAMEYLKATDKTVLDIAFSCGFNNTANFNRAFKKVTGKVPSEYRNNDKSDA